jgi:ABC-2 type transport system ATP-binding protein
MLRRLAGQGKTILLSSHLLGELEQLADWLIMLNQGKVLFCGPARELLAQRVEVVVEAQDAIQLDVVVRIAGDAGYAVTREDGVLRIPCSAGFAETLNRMAGETGAPDLTLRVREASLEQLFLALIKGDHP